VRPAPLEAATAAATKSSSWTLVCLAAMAMSGRPPHSKISEEIERKSVN
jgi:hypothetical protein